MELYTSKCFNQIIHLYSTPRLHNGLNEKVSFDWVSLKSNVFCGLVCV